MHFRPFFRGKDECYHGTAAGECEEAGKLAVQLVSEGVAAIGVEAFVGGRAPPPRRAR
ncbi:MAG: hypothetical protein U0441_14790 [Polyangiaceae bacterium]